MLVSNEIVGASKIARLVALAKEADVSVCVDDAANARDLNAAATAYGVRLPVLVEIDVGAGRCGVAPGEPTLALSRSVATLPGLRFAGVQAYHGKAQHIYDLAGRRAAVEDSIRLTRETVELLRANGLECESVTGAGTGTWQFEAASGVYNELQAGSYVFMDVDYGRVEGASSEFEQSMFVLATVMSRPTADRAILDAGLKAHSVDSGPPAVWRRPDLEVTGVSDEHTNLRLAEPAAGPRLGDKLRLIPGHCDPTVNLYDWFACVRNERVEALWPITARGAVG